ncbi:MAG: hypothetical protein ABI905_07080 [Betaproteobacteria bacterium]
MAMMKIRSLQVSLTALLLAASVCHAKDDVFKCTTPAGVSFQSTPCDAGAAMAKVSSAARHDQDVDEEDDGVPVVKAAPSGNTGRVSIFSRTDRLSPGMSDLQVLNNRRWGKPQRITRNRETNVGWHEYWSYQTGANGGQQLHFVNGVLADVDAIEPVAAEKPSMVSVLMVDGK